MEAICSSETSVASQQTTRRHIPEDDTLYEYKFNTTSIVVSESLFQSIFLFTERFIIQTTGIKFPVYNSSRSVVLLISEYWFHGQK
jgi:hypothetical protein